MTEGPAPNPCGSCPYRQDVPSGVWDAEEYDKLPAYDRETSGQPPGVFLCHQQDGRVCAGWAGCHDMDHAFSLRLASMTGSMSPEDIENTLDYESPVPLWGSGAEAREHGIAEVDSPSREANKIIDKLNRRRGQA